MKLEGWRKAGGFALVILLAAISRFEITAEVVGLYAVFCGVNGVEHWLKR